MPPFFPLTEKKTEAREVEQFTQSHTANAVAEVELELRPLHSSLRSFFFLNTRLLSLALDTAHSPAPPYNSFQSS